MAKGGRRAHSGRKKKPTNLKLIQGTFRDDRHGDEVVVPTKWPDPPASLNDRERELWGALEKQCAAWVAPSDVLAINGVVALVDRILRIEEAQRETSQAGYPLTFEHEIENVDGEVVGMTEAKENPLFNLELKFRRELRAYLGIMGLSPADRARVETPGGPEPKKNPLDRFINRKRG